MKFTFKAEIYKAGINPCVKVPDHISAKMKVEKGYIYIRGKINGFAFQQTLMPVKNEGYRLYVNGPMLKGSNTKPGDTAKFEIEPDPKPRHLESYALPKVFKKELNKNGLMNVFTKLTPSRQKEILRYFGFLKSEEALIRNIEKVIDQLKEINNKHKNLPEPE